MTTQSGEQHSKHDDHGVGHVVPFKPLILTGLGLLVLTAITVAVAQIDLGEMNIWVALAVAVVKATLVALFFMHLFWDRPFNGFIFVGSIAFVVLFIALALTDTFEYRDSLIPR
jgi:cytochrome c oxidase subunit 4